MTNQNVMKAASDAAEVAMTPAEALRHLRQQLEAMRGHDENYMALLEAVFPPCMFNDLGDLDSAIVEMGFVDPECATEMMRLATCFSTELDRVAVQM